MTTKEYLKSIRDEVLWLKRLKARREDYYNDAIAGTGVREAGRISGSRQSSRVENTVCRMLDDSTGLDQLIAQTEQHVRDERRALEAIIRRLPDRRHREILRRRYCQGETWEKICGVMCYERRYMLKLHGEALQNYALMARKKDTLGHL